jgi:predicted Zn-dependent protease
MPRVALVKLIDTWVDLKQRGGTIEALFEHWLLGRAAEPKQPGMADRKEPFMVDVTVRALSNWQGGAMAALLASGLLFSACAVNPVTGRPELVFTTEAGEIRQGEETAKQVAEQIGFVEAPALQAYVRELGQRLARHSQRQGLEYSFHVVEMVEPNAFSLPGGYVYVSRGLLALVNSEDELAAVLGHEIGHVAARHSVSRQAASAPLIPIRIMAGLGGMATGIVAPRLGRAVSATGQLPGALALASYSRGQEREADRLGQGYAAAAGWNPAALSSFMHTLAREVALSGNDPERRSFLASHPSSPERSKQSEKYAKELTQAAVNPVAASREDFLHRLEGVVVGNRAAEGVFVENRFLHPGMNFALAFPKGWEGANSPSDPLEVAEAFMQESELRGQLRPLELGALAAVEGETESDDKHGHSAVYLFWVASGGFVYQIVGVCPISEYAELRGVFRGAAASFHPLSRSEREEIFEKRLRVATAHKGETLGALLERSHNAWEPERAAVANGVELETELVAGTPVKIAALEPYTRSPAGE